MRLKADLKEEITRLEKRLAWLVKMYIRHAGDLRKTDFLYRRMESTSNRIEAYTNALDHMI